MRKLALRLGRGRRVPWERLRRMLAHHCVVCGARRQQRPATHPPLRWPTRAQMAHLTKDPANAERWVTLYPSYIDKLLTIAEGRRIPLSQVRFQSLTLCS